METPIWHIVLYNFILHFYNFIKQDVEILHNAIASLGLRRGQIEYRMRSKLVQPLCMLAEIGKNNYNTWAMDKPWGLKIRDSLSHWIFKFWLICCEPNIWYDPVRWPRHGVAHPFFWKFDMRTPLRTPLFIIFLLDNFCANKWVISLAPISGLYP